MRSDAKKSPFLNLLLAKYRADPEGFRHYLPEVAQALDAMFPPPRRPRSPFGLTDHERAHREASFYQVLAGLEQGTITPEEAVRGLEHGATLVQDDSLPEAVGHEKLAGLLKAAIGKSPGSFKSVKTVLVREAAAREAINHLSLVKGVVLDLDRDMRLVSITVNPRKVGERRKLLKFVGIGQDSASDVALRHDDYLVEKGPHAAS